MAVVRSDIGVCIAVCLMLGGVSTCWAVVDADGFDARQRAGVFAWMNEPPFGISGKYTDAVPTFDYEGWIARGRTLPKTTEVLVSVLNAQNLGRPTEECMRAARSLAHVGDKRKAATDALLRVLTENDIVIREAAVVALGFQGDGDRQKAVTAIEKILADESEVTNVRANAAIGLGRLRPPEAEAILQHATTDKDDFVALCAKEALKILHGMSQ